MKTDAELWEIGMNAIRTLEVDRGILASGKEELYGCMFGRDSLITCLLLLSVYERTKDAYLLTLVRKVLINLAKLQGREVNIESGEEPGKMIHEFRPDNHEHLTKDPNHPWYLYPDGVMRNYDSVDATPLFLMTLDRYHRISHDDGILELLAGQVRDALHWIQQALRESDGFIAYSFLPERTYGGLRVQSWMDSAESLFFEEHDDAPTYSIAPVEVQAYAFAALMVWAKRYELKDKAYADSLRSAAAKMKRCFNELFVAHTNDKASVAYAIDGNGRRLTALRSSIGHCLFALYPKGFGREGILDDPWVKDMVADLLSPELYEPSAGIRTLARTSTRFEANSYHNGSIWPHDTAIVAQGLDEYGYRDEARRVRESLLAAYQHFGVPLELFVYDDGFKEYEGPNGQKACRLQAWSAAALLLTLVELRRF